MRPFSRRPWLLVSAGAVVVLGAVAGAFLLNPWPGSLLVRAVFERGGAKTLEAMEPHTPTGVSAILDVAYRENDPDARLDVYFPDYVVDSDTTLPVVVWTHGGAWISGSRKDAAPYFQLVAAAGYVVVSLDYSLGPEHRYPTALHQIDDAHAYLTAHAERLHLDPERVVLAGDSAGAQLTSQMAAMITDPEYAKAVGITPHLTPDRVKGVVLYCGVYNIDPLLDTTGFVGWANHVTLWGYTGERDVRDSAAAQQMSTIRHVGPQFPRTYISGGNADPLLPQSKALAAELQRLGVDTTTLFFPDDRTPALEHEYQFDLDDEAGSEALDRTLSFVKTVTDAQP